MVNKLPNFLYEDNGIIKLKPGVMAHRLGIIEDPIPAKKRTQYLILENIAKSGLSPYCSSYLSVNITNSLGQNQSINDATDGSYAKYGWDIKTRKYGKKKLSLIFNDKLNQELRAKDKIPDAMLENILDRGIRKYGEKIKSKAPKVWGPASEGLDQFLKDEINKKSGINFTDLYLEKDEHDPIRREDTRTFVKGMVLTYLYDKFWNGKFNDKDKMLEELFYDPEGGLRAYKINNKLRKEPSGLNRDYIEAFAFCKQIRKHKVKTEIKYEPMGKFKDIPIYLIS